MTVTRIVETLTERLLAHESEARAFEAEIERDLFESACGQKFHEGCCEALRDVLDALTPLIDEPVAERADDTEIIPSDSHLIEPGSTG